MSNRLLYFGESRMHFYCGHRMYTENSLLGDQPRYFELLSQSFVNFHHLSRFCGPALDELYETWYSLGADFNSRQWTYREDKFPALAGMAKGDGRDRW